MAATYLSTDGDIKAILRTLVQSPEFNSTQILPQQGQNSDRVHRLGLSHHRNRSRNPGALVNTINTMGMRLYYALPPTGYYITADHWMNSTALVDRLNFAYALTGSKFANQKFDSAHVLALGLMAQPSQPALNQTAASGNSHREILRSHSHHRDTTPPTRATRRDGQDIALHVLESALIGGDVSAQDQSTHPQTDSPTFHAANSTDTLNLLTALVMGSPEFQLR